MEVSDVTMLSTGKYVRQETLSVSKLLLINLLCCNVYSYDVYVMVYSSDFRKEIHQNRCDIVEEDVVRHFENKSQQID